MGCPGEIPTGQPDPGGREDGSDGAGPWVHSKRGPSITLQAKVTERWWAFPVLIPRVPAVFLNGLVYLHPICWAAQGPS